MGLGRGGRRLGGRLFRRHLLGLILLSFSGLLGGLGRRVVVLVHGVAALRGDQALDERRLVALRRRAYGLQRGPQLLDLHALGRARRGGRVEGLGRRRRLGLWRGRGALCGDQSLDEHGFRPLRVLDARGLERRAELLDLHALGQPRGVLLVERGRRGLVVVVIVAGRGALLRGDEALDERRLVALRVVDARGLERCAQLFRFHAFGLSRRFFFVESFSRRFVAIRRFVARRGLPFHLCSL